MKKELTNIRAHAADYSLDQLIGALKALASAYHQEEMLQKLDTISSTYSYMKQYLLAGTVDTQRSALYYELKEKAFGISSEMLHAVLLAENRSLRQARESSIKTPFDYGDIESRLAWFADELAILSLDNADNEKYRSTNEKLFAYRQQLFNTLYSSSILTSSERDAIKDALLSPNADNTDVRIILSALMLSQQVLFDIRKFQILVDFACKTTDEDMRQYAYIAIVFGQPDIVEHRIFEHEIESAFEILKTIPDIKQSLTELQLQILLSTDTERDMQTISNEIMPTLKSNAISIDLIGGKNEKDLLDEILNPDKAEKAMEEMNNSIEKMRKMQENGADVFFGGFAQTKRFSFFYSLVNWFLPFSIHHPQIESINTGEIPAETLEKILSMQNFCDSDRYSFYLAFSTVYNQIPKEFIDIIKKGEARFEFADNIEHNSAFWRRMFLQNLYRFYNLYSSKHDFKNPFTSDETIVFFNWKLMAELFANTQYPLQIARQLLKRNYFTALNKILDNNKDELNISYLKLKALSEYKQKNYISALHWFDTARVFDHDNQLLIRKMADVAFDAEDYNLAYTIYDELCSKNEDDTDEYKMALCCLHTGNVDKALTTLFRLEFEDENNHLYKEALAWGQLLKGRYEEALKLYDAIDRHLLTPVSMIRLFFVNWKLSDNVNALNALRLLKEKMNDSPLQMKADIKRQMIKCYIEIADTELDIFIDLLSSNTL